MRSPSSGLGQDGRQLLFSLKNKDLVRGGGGVLHGPSDSKLYEALRAGTGGTVWGFCL